MAEQPIVITTEGKLQGCIEETHNGCRFYSFMGIPYAKPPIGNLKFKAPRTPDAWDGILKANKENNNCPGMDLLSNAISGEFDCLYLNTFTPELPTLHNINHSVAKPVMVWIHGGKFVSGCKNRKFYDPEYFMDKSVVVVTINYRLGILGFLSLQDPELGVSGNAGLKDQVMALKWVQRNIHAFGGDPNNVTLFGESAGAASVSYHMLSPMSTGLFHKAIMQSGVAACLWAEGHADFGREMVKALGKTAIDEAEIFTILENTGRDELVLAQQKVSEMVRPNKRVFIGPTVETSTTEECFLIDTPKNILKSKNYRKVPVIMGCTTNEGILTLIGNNTNKKPDYQQGDDKFIPYWLHSNITSDKLTETTDKIKRFYFDGEPTKVLNNQCYFDYISDVFIRVEVSDFAKYLIKSSGQKVFLYNFAAVTGLNKFKMLFNLPEVKGVCHAEDVFYMFKTLLTPYVEPNSTEYNAIQKTTTWWTNFAKFSDPNIGTNNDFVWPPATENMEYLNIDVDPSLGDKFCKNVTNFWKSLGADLL